MAWTLSIAGRTESVPATLNDVYAIDALKRIGGASDGSTPPVMKFSPAGPSAAGPAGITTTLKASGTNPVTLDVWVADDRSAAAPGATAPPTLQPTRPLPRSPLRVAWSKYRGPGVVHFSNPEPAVEQGKASTTATFTEAGEYILRAVASRGSSFGGQCCWTNGYATVIVGPAGQGR